MFRKLIEISFSYYLTGKHSKNVAMNLFVEVTHDVSVHICVNFTILKGKCTHAIQCTLKSALHIKYQVGLE